MSFADARKAVQAFFATNWASRTNIAWPDVEYKPTKATWVRFNMVNNTGNQATIGGATNLYRRNGLITIQVLSPENKGGVDALAKADIAAEIFITQRLAGFEFSEVNVREAGNTGDGFYQVIVTIAYRYDTLA